MLGPADEVDDVVQDTFIRAYETLDRFRGNAAFATYLHRIAINRSLDALRRRKRWQNRFVRHEEAALPAAGPSMEEDIERSDQARLVHAAIGQLKPDHRAVVALRLLEGFSTRETSDILGITYGTVLSRLSRAMQALRELLSGILTVEDIH